jgi:hypothetical protein
MHNEQEVLKRFNEDIKGAVGENRHKILDFNRFYSENPKRAEQMVQMEQEILTHADKLRQDRQALEKERQELDKESRQLDHKHEQITEYLDKVKESIEITKTQNNNPEAIQGTLEDMKGIKRDVESELNKFTSSDAYAAQIEKSDNWTEKYEKLQEKLSQFDDFLQHRKEELAKWRITQIETIIRKSQDYRPQREDYKVPETSEQREREVREIMSKVDTIGPYWVTLGVNGPQEKKDEIEIQKLNLKRSVYTFGQNERDSGQEFQVRSDINTLLQMGVDKSEIQDLVNCWRYLGSYQLGKGAMSSEDRAIARLQGSEANPGEASIFKDQRLEAHKKELFYHGLSENAFALGKIKRNLGEADASSNQRLRDKSEFEIYQIKSNIQSELDRVAGSGGDLNFDETKIGLACRQ